MSSHVAYAVNNFLSLALFRATPTNAQVSNVLLNSMAGSITKRTSMFLRKTKKQRRELCI